MGKVNFAIIGCGRIAERHAVYISKLGNLLAVCDVKPDRAQKLGVQFGAKTYTSIDELLINENKLDVVTICTPNGLHDEQTI